MAKTLYDYWFVQNADKNWERKPIREWILSEKSGDWGKENIEGNYTLKVSCIRGADIPGLNGQNELKSPIRFILEKNRSKILSENDLIIEISGGSPTQSTGRMAFITKETLNRFENPLICSNFCKAITLKSKENIFYFAYLWQHLYDNNLFFGYEGKTSGIKNLLFDNFVNSYYSVVPDKEIIKKFNSIIVPMQKQKQKLLLENYRLTQVRDWLLPMLMNGQVSVNYHLAANQWKTKYHQIQLQPFFHILFDPINPLPLPKNVVVLL
ncbi:hypothetical protein AGMMS49574_17150 [Bacteroidia bacterium]|nr:hypothetical protein AGMMS49574_17150 [Bacteroidia bacterium]